MTNPNAGRDFAGQLRKLELAPKADVTASLRDDMADLLDQGMPPAVVGAAAVAGLVGIIARLEHEVAKLTGESIRPPATD